jgi:hypothetical protein
MKLALRKTHADGANWGARLAAWAIKARLVSQYCHAGMVVGNTLYHATPTGGLHATTDWQPHKWVLIDCGQFNHNGATELFTRFSGARYDWFSLLAFVGLRTRDSRRMYCYEWCWLCLTRYMPNQRITPEMLIEKAYELKLKDTQ